MLSGVHRDTIVQTVHPHKYKGMHYKMITDGAVTHQMFTYHYINIPHNA